MKLSRCSALLSPKNVLLQRAKKKKGQGQKGPEREGPFDLDKLLEQLEGKKRDLSPPWKKGEEPEWLKVSYARDKEGKNGYEPYEIDEAEHGYIGYMRKKNKVKIKLQNFLKYEFKQLNWRRRWGHQFPTLLETLKVRVPESFRRKRYPVMKWYAKEQNDKFFMAPGLLNFYQEPENPNPAKIIEKLDG
eukprot:TRINITY_DN4462_c0_g1_i1.p1 TRINITY_DN4462_c0_g1~~TRINITY_DN4462_c0_g1_i1.p1  ORF type:complete len:189 (-),score=30.34 TRINITY_DN4462_c0_g1_i1:36-602(-)